MKRSILLLLFLLTACANRPPGSVPIAPGVLLTLPAPSSLGRQLEAVQLVTARHGEETVAFEAHLQVTRDEVLLVGTDGFGQRLVSISWDGRTIIEGKATFLPDTLHPEQVLADVMLIYWPEAEMRAGIKGGDFADGRIVKDGQELIVLERDPDPWSGHSRFIHRAWNYEIDVRSSLVSP